MKFFYLLVVLAVLLMLSIAAHAQNNYPKQEISGGIGLIPARPVGVDSEPFEFSDDNKYYTTDEKFTPSEHFQYLYNLKEWLSVGSFIGYYHSRQNMCVSQSNEFYSKARMDYFVVLPTVRFTFYRSSMVRLYGEVSTGLVVTNKRDFGEESYKSGCESTLQMNFFGISVGKKLFGFATVGLGELVIFNGGVVYRF